MSEDLENNVRNAFSQIRVRFRTFDSMHPRLYNEHMRLIEKDCKLQQGQLGLLFRRYCTTPIRPFAQRVYNNRLDEDKIPEIPYKIEYRRD